MVLLNEVERKIALADDYYHWKELLGLTFCVAKELKDFLSVLAECLFKEVIVKIEKLTNRILKLL